MAPSTPISAPPQLVSTRLVWRSAKSPTKTRPILRWEKPRITPGKLPVHQFPQVPWSLKSAPNGTSVQGQRLQRQPGRGRALSSVRGRILDHLRPGSRTRPGPVYSWKKPRNPTRTSVITPRGGQPPVHHNPRRVQHESSVSALLALQL